MRVFGLFGPNLREPVWPSGVHWTPVACTTGYGWGLYPMVDALSRGGGLPMTSGVQLLKDPVFVSQAVDRASRLSKVHPSDWAPPAAYGKGLWPKADFSYVRDPVLMRSLTGFQDWVRALRHARADARMSLRQLGFAAGSTPNAMSELDLGARWPSVSLMLRVSAVLGVEMSFGQ
jgi:hypothetical protein